MGLLLIERLLIASGQERRRLVQWPERAAPLSPEPRRSHRPTKTDSRAAAHGPSMADNIIDVKHSPAAMRVGGGARRWHGHCAV